MQRSSGGLLIAQGQGGTQRMQEPQLGWITDFIWGIADDVLRDLYVRGKYRDVILPMTVLRRPPYVAACRSLVIGG